jgi:hypothetical protein
MVFEATEGTMRQAMSCSSRQARAGDRGSLRQFHPLPFQRAHNQPVQEAPATACNHNPRASRSSLHGMGSRYTG